MVIVCLQWNFAVKRNLTPLRQFSISLSSSSRRPNLTELQSFIAQGALTCSPVSSRNTEIPHHHITVQYPRLFESAIPAQNTHPRSPDRKFLSSCKPAKPGLAIPASCRPTRKPRDHSQTVNLHYYYIVCRQQLPPTPCVLCFLRSLKNTQKRTHSPKVHNGQG